MSQNRIEWIDLVRAIAILTVLYIHATDGIYIISSDAIMNYTLFSRIFQFASLFIGRIGVPFFLMKLMTMRKFVDSGQRIVKD